MFRFVGYLEVFLPNQLSARSLNDRVWTERTYGETTFRSDKDLLPSSWVLGEETTNQSLVVPLSVYLGGVPECTSKFNSLGEYSERIFIIRFTVITGK
jgi:hypothetical protein